MSSSLAQRPRQGGPIPLTNQAATTAQAPQQTGSRTQTQTQTQTAAPTVLRLRGAHRTNRPRVQWREDVVDNEGLGRKSSKVCCIYHRPKGVDESSDESSSDSSSSSESESDGGGPGDGRRRVGGSRRSGKDKKKAHKHSHDHDHDHDHDCDAHDGAERRRSGNAYEKMPRYKPRGQPKADGSGPSSTGRQ